MKLDVWPFLVSRNRVIDYITIVAPDFMCKAGAAWILAKIAGGNTTDEEVAFYREIHKSKVGQFTLIFRVIETTLENMGIEGSGVLKDEFGREIRLIEGIFIKELVNDVIVTKEDIQKAHSLIIQPYREFWECTSTQPATPSERFELLQDSSKSCLRYQRQEPYIGDIAQHKNELVDKPQETNAARVDNYQKNKKWRSNPSK